jgi:choline dehydrogenase
MRSPSFEQFFEPVPANDDPWSYWWPYSSSDIDTISDQQLLRWMEEKAFTLYHPVGTARMGSSPSTSVVDERCRVHGVQNLRVMDASVFPDQISGHPTAPIGAMAFKFSEMLRKEYAQST